MSKRKLSAVSLQQTAKEYRAHFEWGISNFEILNAQIEAFNSQYSNSMPTLYALCLLDSNS